MITKATRPTHYNTRYKHHLSPRQRQVLDLVMRGHTNAEIAQELGLSLDGAKWHVREILTKLSVDSREEAAHYWRQYNRPTARFARAIAGLGFGGGMAKAVLIGGGAVIAGVAIAGGIAAFVAANDDGGDDLGQAPIETPTAQPSTPSPAPSTPTPTPEPQDGRDRAEQFARTFAPLVAARDYAGMFAIAEPESVTCPGAEPQGLGGPFPLCDGAAEGEVRQGFQVTLAGSEGQVRSEAQMPVIFDNYALDTAELGSIGCAADAADCERFVAAFNIDGLYAAFAFEARNDTHVLVGFAFGGDNAQEVLEGGTTFSHFGEVTFEPVTP